MAASHATQWTLTDEKRSETTSSLKNRADECKGGGGTTDRKDPTDRNVEEVAMVQSLGQELRWLNDLESSTLD